MLTEPFVFSLFRFVQRPIKYVTVMEGEPIKFDCQVNGTKPIGGFDAVTLCLKITQYLASLEMHDKYCKTRNFSGNHFSLIGQSKSFCSSNFH